MVEMELFWQIGPMTNILNVIQIMIFQSRYPVSHMFNLNRSVLCNSELKAESHFFLESLAAYQELESKLTMYFTMNLAFINYFDNLIKSLEFQILLNRIINEQIVPNSLETVDVEPE